jgi:hypothetical protein
MSALRVFRHRSVVLLLLGGLALMLLAAPAGASALSPTITVLTSSTHPSETAWYSSHTVDFHWEGSPVNYCGGFGVDGGQLPYYSTTGQDYMSDMQAVGDLLYVAAFPGGTEEHKPILAVFDLAASPPEMIGAWGGQGYVGPYEGDIESLDAQNVAVQGHYAYAGLSDSSEDGYWYLGVIDVSDPAAPTLAGITDSFGPKGDFGGIAVRGSYVYITRRYNDYYDDPDAGWVSLLYVVDVSNPSQPHVAGSCVLPGAVDYYPAEHKRMAVKEGYLYVPLRFDTSNNPWLCQVDVRDPLAPRRVTELDHPCGDPLVSGDLLFAAGPDCLLGWPGDYGFMAYGGLEVFDISNPGSPQWLGAMKGEVNEWPSDTEYEGVSLTASQPTLSKQYVFDSTWWFSEEDLFEDDDHYIGVYDVTQPLDLDPFPSYISMMNDYDEFDRDEAPDLVAYANDRLVCGYYDLGAFFVEHIGPVAYSYSFDQSPSTVPPATAMGGKSGLGADYTVTAPAEGIYYFHVRAKDGNGTWGPTVTRKVQIGSGPSDTTAPTTVASGAVNGKWYRAAVTVSFAASDNAGGSGVASTEYSLDGGEWTKGSSLLLPAPADHSGDLLHTILYRSADIAGNVEAQKTVKVGIDTRKPTTKATASASARRGRSALLRYQVLDAVPNAGTATVTIKIRNRAGKVVATLRLGAKPVNTATPLSKSFKVPATWKAGTYGYYVCATDKALNAQVLPVGSNRLVVR